MSILDDTEDFMKAAGQLEQIGFPEDYDDKIRELRRRLVKSEFKEFWLAEENNDRVEVADGLLDVIVTAWGGMLAYFGPTLSRRLAADVGDSNLSKILEDGTCLKDAGGKVLKPDGYRAPRIREILLEWDEEQQSYTSSE